MSGLAGAACVACCAIPLLLTVGVLGGAGWVATGRVMPGIALGLIAVAAAAWWWTFRHRARGCAGGDCSCHREAAEEPAQVRSGP